MEQHRTRPAQYGPRRSGAPLPAQGRGGAVARPPAGRVGPPAGRRPEPVRPAPGAPSPVARVVRALRGMPNPRLTGLGSGLFCAAVMTLLGFLDELLFGSSLTAYGVLFVPVSLLTALWVRRGDLLTAPVVVPIAFAVGLVPVAESGDGGLGGRLMGIVTALATEAGWLYGGTLVAGSTVIVRRIRLMRRRAAAARNRPPA
ncbi:MULTISPECIES: DUF6542 domain-containing protein [Streptomyces]|uniref:Integral membrane protein n=1 Tax=Streptomyces coelicolor (strain ATCC BAA-471 / A3(2) / M145) TaxID=100226 RepID=Q9ADE7_STRCO|nr:MULTISPECIES: DUF6542 domain-containing protein [Streptomyces]MYU44582.1 hypothetical protein [Streptomyces sp. SID7813]MDX2930074.1 hypothetical protein [Streptomyces sp. NRRL_B-16638]MDX3407667.1 hypothetical protein [Streptomyces sp. ME02-6977A]NSL78031.1 hypothetical protein [Streptomyces coelicolor]QFI44960.1 hypothetical protein FQ762_26145 [Streptomyces coelicolor A3(2)]